MFWTTEVIPLLLSQRMVRCPAHSDWTLRSRLPLHIDVSFLNVCATFGYLQPAPIHRQGVHPHFGYDARQNFTVSPSIERQNRALAQITQSGVHPP